MNKEEFTKLAKGMKAVYTSQNFLPDSDAMKVWFAMLQDLDYKPTSIAVQKYMMTNKFPPTIADIREFSDLGADIVIDCAGMNMTSELENAFYVNNVKMLFQIANQDTASSIETIFNSMAIGP